MTDPELCANPFYLRAAWCLAAVVYGILCIGTSVRRRHAHQADSSASAFNLNKRPCPPLHFLYVNLFLFTRHLDHSRRCHAPRISNSAPTSWLKDGSESLTQLLTQIHLSAGVA